MLGSKEIADDIVRRIVAHYRIQPYLPHVVFICNGGPCQMSFGVDTVLKIESAIAHASVEKSVPNGPSPLPVIALKRIINNAEGVK